MNETKDNTNIDEKNIVEQKEANKEPIKLLPPEEIKVLKDNAQLIEDFGKYLGDEELGKKWKQTLEQGTPEEISAEYRKLGHLSEAFAQFLQERLQIKREAETKAIETTKSKTTQQNGVKETARSFPVLDESFEKTASKAKNTQPAITLDNAFGVECPGVGG